MRVFHEFDGVAYDEKLGIITYSSIVELDVEQLNNMTTYEIVSCVTDFYTSDEGLLETTRGLPPFFKDSDFYDKVLHFIRQLDEREVR